MYVSTDIPSTRHADLLRFIAQKEAKCLELRSQLATHEAELAQLKRKWERIVSRGMDRAYSSSSQQASSYALDNIKEGVQGAARLLAAGLVDLSSPPTPTSRSTFPSAPARSAPLPFAASARLNRGHMNTQSTSSSDTTSSSLTRSSFRLSQSSVSSLAADDLPIPGTSHSHDPSKTERVESPVEISPASATMATKLHRRKSRDHASNTAGTPPSAWSQSPLTPTPISVSSGDDQQKRKAKRQSLQLSGTLPAPSVMPGLGSLASPEVAAWMGSVGSSVGKKWEEIQRGDRYVTPRLATHEGS